MKSSNMNRRQWIKSGALLTGGLSVLPAAWQGLTAAAPAPLAEAFTGEEQFLKAIPPEITARLSANENPFGPCDKAKAAIVEAMSDCYQYPFHYIRQLAQKIAETEGVSRKQLIMGAGSTPLLVAAALYFAREGGTIISGDPSYEDLPGRAALFSAKWEKVPLTADYKLDLDEMEKRINSNTSLIYICNPNNPTATVLDRDKLQAFCARVSAKVPVFVDEAYIDYLEDPQAASMVDCVKKGMDVIVARTFSKLHGFAGLRVGYAMGKEVLIEKISRYTTGGMSLSATSVNAALASYNDAGYLADARSKTNASKAYLCQVLKEEGYDYIPSAANFVLFPLKMEGRRFVQEMFKRGVSIRSWNFSGQHWCRVSIGTMKEMEAFAKAFKELS